jgi:antitoxin component of MazEF toxin-antitoxin module
MKINVNNIIGKWIKTKLDKTGNSQCIIIPKKYIKMLDLNSSKIDIIVTKEEIIIKKFMEV